jgi:hypothetical protein
MLMDPITYLTVNPDHPYQEPMAPAPPAYAGLTGPQILEANRLFAEAQKERKEYLHLDAALVKQIANAIEPMYLQPLHQPYVGLLGLSAQTILAWMMQNYGAIMPQELTDNRRKLDASYNPTSEPFQILTSRVQQTREFASDGGLPISDAEAINASLAVLEASGVLERAIETWKEMPAAARTTWQQFKQHFQPKVLQYQKTRRTMGAHFGNSAQHQQKEPGQEQFAEWMLSQECNANAVANMAATQTALIENLAMMQKALTDITQQLNNTEGGPTPNRRGDRFQRAPAKDNGSYCWTHGYLVHKDHLGATCKSCAIGHKKEATRANPMGGNLTGKPT